MNLILQVLLDIPSNVAKFLLAPRVSNHDGHPQHKLQTLKKLVIY